MIDTGIVIAFYKKHLTTILFLISFCVSIVATIYFYQHGMKNLSNYDAFARLNVARKIINSLTPGIGQMGAIWLPFPQILFVLFVWNDFLWHTGFAGAIISGAAFIIASVYLQKTAFLITKNRIASILVWFMFVTNINILLFQSMAMSESFFLFCIIMIIYFFTTWTTTHELIYFIIAAFFVALGTLTRYEGYFIFIGAIITTVLELFMLYGKERNFSKIEGMLLLFLTIASYGILLWCLYCFIFFKDPLHWLHLYAQSGTTIAPAHTQQKTLFDSFRVYSEITIWMNGILISLLSIVGFLFVLGTFIKKIIKKQTFEQYLPLLVFSCILFPLLVYGYLKGYTPHITFESLTLPHILDKKFNIFPDTQASDGPNIRYGLTMTPFVLLFAGFFMAKGRIWLLTGVIVVLVQLFTNFYTPLHLQFSVPAAANTYLLPAATWFRSHYTGGLIFTSANANEDFIFQTGLPYNDFIYEGTRGYWYTSFDDPGTYATWIVYQHKTAGDLIYETLPPSSVAIINKNFTLVYQDDKTYKIYKRKDARQ